jgi:hypothetical protein
MNGAPGFNGKQDQGLKQARAVGTSLLQIQGFLQYASRGGRDASVEMTSIGWEVDLLCKSPGCPGESIHTPSHESPFVQGEEFNVIAS